MIVFLLRAIFVGFEIGDEQAFRDGLGGSGAAFAFAREKHELLHAARFQIAQRGAGDFAQVADGEFLGLPCPDEEQPLRVHALREMQENEFEGFSGDFAARGQGGEAGRSWLRSISRENAIEFVFLSKT